jgi:hypothetical protein
MLVASFVNRTITQPESRGCWMEPVRGLMALLQLRAFAASADAAPDQLVADRVPHQLGSRRSLLLEVVLTKNGTLWATGLFASTFWFLGSVARSANAGTTG